MSKIASNGVGGSMVISRKIFLKAAYAKWILERPCEDSPEIDLLESE